MTDPSLTQTPSAPPLPKLYKASLWMMLASLVIIALSLTVAGLAFSTFLGGGRSWIGVAQSFGVCFGAAAVVYMPALLQFFMARHVRAYGPKKAIGFASVLLSIPFWSYTGASLLADYPFKIWLIATLAYGLFMLVWGIANVAKA